MLPCECILDGRRKSRPTATSISSPANRPTAREESGLQPDLRQPQLARPKKARKAETERTESRFAAASWSPEVATSWCMSPWSPPNSDITVMISSTEPPSRAHPRHSISIQFMGGSCGAETNVPRGSASRTAPLPRAPGPNSTRCGQDEALDRAAQAGELLRALAGLRQVDAQASR